MVSRVLFFHLTRDLTANDVSSVTFRMCSKDTPCKREGGFITDGCRSVEFIGGVRAHEANAPSYSPDNLLEVTMTGFSPEEENTISSYIIDECNVRDSVIRNGHAIQSRQDLNDFYGVDVVAARRDKLTHFTCTWCHTRRHFTEFEGYQTPSYISVLAMHLKNSLPPCCHCRPHRDRRETV